jgi:hypothetical protein
METTQVERRRMVTLPQEEFEAVLERAAERGALNALHEVGLDGEDAARDIRALRNLLDAWREARMTAWRTVVKAVTTGLLLALVAGAIIKLKVFRGWPMIETLLGGLLGGVFRLAPEILKWMDRNGERGHELAMQDKALEFEKIRGAQRMAEIGASADAAWNTGAIDALRDAVRTQGEKTGVLVGRRLVRQCSPCDHLLVHGAVLRRQDGSVRGGCHRWCWLGHGDPARMDRGGPGAVGWRAELLVPWARVRPGAVVTEVAAAAIDLAKRFEGFHRVPKVDPGRAHPYICPAGYWTIGYGHLCDPKHPSDHGR